MLDATRVQLRMLQAPPTATCSSQSKVTFILELLILIERLVFYFIWRFILLFLIITIFQTFSSELPVIESHPSALDVILNNPVSLPCRATGSPRPTITWQKEGINIPTTGKWFCLFLSVGVSNQSWNFGSGFVLGGRSTILPNGSLQISKASLSDSGMYICVAQNPAGTALGKTRLRVQGRYFYFEISTSQNAPKVTEIQVSHDVNKYTNVLTPHISPHTWSPSSDQLRHSGIFGTRGLLRDAAVPSWWLPSPLGHVAQRRARAEWNRTPEGPQFRISADRLHSAERCREIHLHCCQCSGHCQLGNEPYCAE